LGQKRGISCWVSSDYFDLAWLRALCAQNYGEINGTVSDPTGAVIAGQLSR
jgi:hypothetical protein